MEPTPPYATENITRAASRPWLQLAARSVQWTVDGPANGYGRANSQGIDMNRSYSADGTNPEKQAHEAYLVQKDLEGIMASESPVSLCWSMHTWEGEKVEPLLCPGADILPIVKSGVVQLG